MTDRPQGDEAGSDLLQATPSDTLQNGPGLVADAKRLLASHEYAQVIELLENAPEGYCRSSESGQLLQQARILKAEADRLFAQVRQAVRDQQYAGLRPVVERLLELEPGNVVAREVFEKLATPSPGEPQGPSQARRESPAVSPSGRPQVASAGYRRWVDAAVVLGLLGGGLWLGVVLLRVKDKDGNVVAEVQVPTGGTGEIVRDGKVIAEEKVPTGKSPAVTNLNKGNPFSDDEKVATSKPPAVTAGKPSGPAPPPASNPFDAASDRESPPSKDVPQPSEPPASQPAAPGATASQPSGPAPSPAIAPFDATKAKEHQAAWAKHLGVPVELENWDGMRFVLIPPGEFDMGWTEAEVAKLVEEAKAKNLPTTWYSNRLPAAAPKHRVRITQPFYLGRCEVTQAEYARLGFGNEQGHFQGDLNRPMESVSWEEASAFCRNLGFRPQEQAVQAQYRLPTEAEWEYACRAGTTTAWYCGDDEAALKEHAWFRANAEGTTHPVGQKAPNAWGLYDMHGNAWEWCQDWFAADYYRQSPAADPTGPPEGTFRVHRGGSWFDLAEYGRGAYRGWYSAMGRNSYLGFRVARSVSVKDRGAEGPAPGDGKAMQSPDRPAPQPTEPPASQRKDVPAGHTAEARGVAYSPDGKILASCSNDRTVRLWEVTTGRLLETLEGHRDKVRCLAFAPDGSLFASGSDDGAVILWDGQTHAASATLSGSQGAVPAVAFSPDGKTLASASQDAAVKLWNLETGECQTLIGNQGVVRAAAFSPDGKTLAWSRVHPWTARGLITVWNVALGQIVRVLRGPEQEVQALAFSCDSQILALAGNGKTVGLWDVSSGRQRASLPGHTQEVFGVAFAPDGRRLASAGGDQTVRLWDVPPSIPAVASEPDPAAPEVHPKFTLTGHNREILCLALDAHTHTLFAGDLGGQLRVWDLGGLRQTAALAGHPDRVWSVRVSPDGNTLASSGGEKSPTLWDAKTHEKLGMLPEGPQGLSFLAFSPDGKTLAGAGGEGTITLWDLATKQARLTLTGHKRFVNAIAFSPDGKTLASCGHDDTTRLWDAETGECRRVITAGDGFVQCLAWSADGQTLATGGYFGAVHLWDPQTGLQRRLLRGQAGYLEKLAFSPNGLVIAACSQEDTIRLWSVATGQLRARLTGHAGAVYDLAFHREGSTLVSAGWDQAIRLWDVSELVQPTPEEAAAAQLQRESQLVVRAVRGQLADSERQQLQAESWVEAIVGDTPIPYDRWTFVAVTLRNGGANRGDLSVRVNDQTSQHPFQSIDYSDGDAYLRLGGGFVGILDEFTLFDRALAEEEIEALYQRGVK